MDKYAAGDSDDDVIGTDSQTPYMDEHDMRVVRSTVLGSQSMRYRIKAIKASVAASRSAVVMAAFGE